MTPESVSAIGDDPLVRVSVLAAWLIRPGQRAPCSSNRCYATHQDTIRAGSATSTAPAGLASPSDAEGVVERAMCAASVLASAFEPGLAFPL